MTEGKGSLRESLRRFPTKLLKAGRDNSVNEELDPIRSEVGGYIAVTSASTHFTVYTIPTATPAKALHVDTLIITNREASATTYTIYDSTGVTTVTALIIVGATETYTLTGLKGLIHTTGVYVRASQYTTGSSIRAGGLLRDQLRIE